MVADATSPDPAHEAAHAEARALGASPVEAETVIARLAEAGLLRHGLAVVAVVAAARGGVEPIDALRAIASGSPLPQGISDYELRVAAEEADAELNR
jgi:hypothetical protein